jgi:hypothetical protein
MSMHIVLEAIIWGLLWEFPITCLLALFLAVLGASFWGVWGAVVGGATGLAIGTVLDVVVWRITAWVPGDPRKRTTIWAGALGMLAILSIVLAIVYWSP